MADKQHIAIYRQDWQTLKDIKHDRQREGETRLSLAELVHELLDKLANNEAELNRLVKDEQ